MIPRDFLEHVRAHLRAGWLEDAVDDVDRRMDSDGGHDFGHLARVFSNAHTIVTTDGRGTDFEAVVAAIVFHDVVNLAKNDPERHLASTRSAEVARAFFEERDAELDIDLVAEAIRCHSFSAGIEPQSWEAKVVADADNLEAIGAFGIARTFYVSGRMGSAIVDMADPHAERRELDDTRWALDHFQRKLLGLRNQMHTDVGRAMADSRDAFMRSFLDQLYSEIGSAPPGVPD